MRSHHLHNTTVLLAFSSVGAGTIVQKQQWAECWWLRAEQGSGTRVSCFSTAVWLR